MSLNKQTNKQSCLKQSLLKILNTLPFHDGIKDQSPNPNNKKKHLSFKILKLDTPLPDIPRATFYYDQKYQP